MRLFVALDIDAEIRIRIESFVRNLKSQVPDVRLVGPETYHITLKFLGETSKVDVIRDHLRTVQSPLFDVSFRGTGFFPSAQRPRVFWAGIEGGAELAALAGKIDSALAPLGFEREKGPYRPHLTLSRKGSGNPRNHRAPANTGFQHVQQILSSMSQPEFGTMTAREFFLYESRLSPAGASYTKLERFTLG
ncbi:MAG TPA: RNA 2',3'-cyclic phosphodiesterase [candidate division Zixibacteria bacterium]|nr:RNA 2',3'-cyclic phosphodiesterase [candidate division Zixibacteria bacterium]